MWRNFKVSLTALVLCLSAVSSRSREKLPDDDDDLFVPTRAWQVVKKGQKIPKGLHVRINLETGVTEAKLMQESEEEKMTAVVEVPDASRDSARISKEQTAGYLKFSEAKLKEALKNIKNDYDTTEKNVQDTKSKFKSYEELKKDLGDLNLTPKTDLEVLKELVAQHRLLSDTKSEEILPILEDLEFLVHQYDNANEFVSLNGFKEVIYRGLNSTNVEIKKETLKLLGSSMQNNAKVQIHALETGSVGIILRIVALESDYGVKNRAIFALSSLLRHFPLAQLQFTENAGLSVFAELLEKATDIKVQLKIVTLINDLILEHDFAAMDSKSVNYSNKIQQYTLVDLKKKLEDHSWCRHLSNLLTNIVRVDSNDHDSIEKCLTAIITVKDTCDLLSSTNVKDIVLQLQMRYRSFAVTEEFEESDSHYYSHLLNLCTQITGYLNYKLKTEL